MSRFRFYDPSGGFHRLYEELKDVESWFPAFPPGLGETYPACKHPSVKVEFDEASAMKMTAPEVQRRYPRFHGVCPDCGQNLIMYASAEHYIAGDW